MREVGRKEEASDRAHVLVFPYPSQGHINPMLQFAKRLLHKGLKVSVVTTIFLNKTMEEAQPGPINVELISDGWDEGGHEQAESIDAYLERFEAVGAQSLINLFHKLSASGSPVDCLVYDSFLAWALEVAKQVGVPAGSFLTQSCAVDALYYNVCTGRLSHHPSAKKAVFLPGLPEFLPSELPSLISAPDDYPVIRQFVLNQFRDIEKADWILCNTVHELEPDEANWLKTFLPVKTIGPTVPSLYLDKRVGGDNDYGLSLWKKESGACKEWLNSNDDGSVIYVSFGSLASLKPEQMEEIACALKDIDHNFLWVVRASEESKIPESFVEETRGKGLIVKWCPQLEVLSHRAVGCFVTHCGWNSTLEGLSLGVPMVAFPQWSDQPTNAKYIEQVWKVGVRARLGDNGILSREELKKCVKEVMEGEKGKEMRRNAGEWRKVAREALEEGGSSDRNLEELVAVFSHVKSSFLSPH